MTGVGDRVERSVLERGRQKAVTFFTSMNPKRDLKVQYVAMSRVRGRLRPGLNTQVEVHSNNAELKTHDHLERDGGQPD